jgi:hypothetical protein
MSDMLDVLHFFFEEDFIHITTGEQAEARDKSRSMLYGQLYHREYKYAAPTTGRTAASPGISGPLDEDLEIEDIPTPIDPFQRSRETKPYIPPTQVNENSRLPFGAALDEPLG